MNPVIPITAGLLSAGLVAVPTADRPTTVERRIEAVSPQVPDRWLAPLTPLERVRPFHRPASTWSRGHRGVDLQGAVGATVRAVDGGIVVAAGPVAGRGVISVQHLGLRSTYEPVLPSVAVGERVEAGGQIGTLAPGGHCPGCLHLGAKYGTGYLDPWPLLAPGVRLLPTPASPR